VKGEEKKKITLREKYREEKGTKKNNLITL